MSEVAIGASHEGDGAFRRATMLLIVAIGTLAFIATLVLGAYAPDLRSGKNGGAHALSNAATGFSGLVRLAEKTGRNPVIVRSAGQLDSAFRRGRYASTNLLYSLSKNVLTGVEYVWGDLETKDGSSAPDYRLQFSTKVGF